LSAKSVLLWEAVMFAASSKEENIDAWLNPDPKNLDAMHAILEYRARPYYEYRMAA
jgi:hypothetical protein